MSEQFKAGDEVYCPNKGLAVYRLVEQRNTHYPVMIDGYGTYQVNGLASASLATPSIFHATPENKQLLEALYKCEFESPKLKGSDLTRKLLSEGKHVLCYVGNGSDKEASKNGDCQVIINCSTHSFGEWQFESSVDFWLYAVPCKDYSNLVDGVLIKSEQ